MSDEGWTQASLGAGAREHLDSVPPDIPAGMPPEKWATMNRAERRRWKKGKRP